MSDTPRVLRLMHQDMQGRLGEYAQSVLPMLISAADEIDRLSNERARLLRALQTAMRLRPLTAEEEVQIEALIKEME